ncbi:aminotransferase-like domain-containing protein [Sphingobacterium sp. MYb382]|uniref:aminotransferase-like domain-containing protein n=1 Tax=Sphingobacterium sp. MYb382 TaxID=2745278 RepID=UPI0030A55639
MAGEYLYHKIANSLEHQIRSGLLKEGDKLPSLRTLCQQHQISMNTAKRIFLELEALSLIAPRPQSGYFVSTLPARQLPLPAVSRPDNIANVRTPDLLLSKIYASMGREDLTLLSFAAPAAELLPMAKLKKELLHATKTLHQGGIKYELAQGNVNLRRMVAIRSIGWGGSLHEDDLVTTSGGMEALSFAMMALGKAGDTIAVESPCYPGILELAVSLGFKVLELPTHPITGIELEGLKQAIPHIDFCLLIPNFNTPLGSCMPDAHKKEIVELLAKHQIPLIEDDVYGDLYFGKQRPRCCKSFDKEGNVLWCSSVSKNLAPGYRVGWIAPGRFKEQVLKLKLRHVIASTSITQEAVANFLRSGKYDTHLREFRKTLEQNYHHFARAVADYFPEGTKVSRPQGGLTLWIELHPTVDTLKLHDILLEQGISVAPGRMFTLQDQFEHCLRLCIAVPWTAAIEAILKKIGALVRSPRVLKS